jgi:hypothetical protein
MFFVERGRMTRQYRAGLGGMGIRMNIGAPLRGEAARNAGAHQKLLRGKVAGEKADRYDSMTPEQRYGYYVAPTLGTRLRRWWKG